MKALHLVKSMRGRLLLGAGLLVLCAVPVSAHQVLQKDADFSTIKPDMTPINPSTIPGKEPADTQAQGNTVNTNQKDPTLPANTDSSDIDTPAAVNENASTESTPSDSTPAPAPTPTPVQSGLLPTQPITQTQSTTPVSGLTGSL